LTDADHAVNDVAMCRETREAEKNCGVVLVEVCTLKTFFVHIVDAVFQEGIELSLELEVYLACHTCGAEIVKNCVTQGNLLGRK